MAVMLGNEQDNPEISLSVAEEISKMWAFAKQEDFAEYMSQNYGISIKPNPGWKKLVILEAREACFEEMNFPAPVLLRRHWVVDNGGLMLVGNPMIQEAVQGVFYEMPIIKFCTNSELVLISERLGPGLLFRRLHRITFEGGNVSIGKPIRKQTYL